MRTVLTILLIAVIGGICALEAVFIRQGRRMPKRSCVRLSVAYPIVGVVFGAMFLYLMNMAVHEQDSNPWVAAAKPTLRSCGSGVDQLPHLV